ncbi:hypothetical protein QJS83_14775 [Bdellovibrio sp. 22V]|uniref:hypothetical protein n=1 Tax=Bdellovibrio sp. 22V TaxID=3044166 RepID=UPI00254390DC|nr:hypothetical protein [Bdellovibrio sp. 22V]WII71727.1 hypothetical protein QJS83_14775 [Bdellovibrio sp. 22V]
MIKYVANLVSAGFCPGQDNFDKLNEHEQHVILQLANVREKYDRNIHENADVLKRAGGCAFISYTEKGIGNVYDYLRFIEYNQQVIQKRGTSAMYTGIAYPGDEQQTWNALAFMESRGFSPIPVYVIGHDVRLLKHYCENYSNVVIIGAEGSPRQQFEILDHIWTNYVVAADFETKAKMHALELSSPAIIDRYNWDSYDNADWLRVANSGDIMMSNGFQLCLTDNESKKVTRKHIATVPSLLAHEATVEITVAGFDINRLMSSRESRAVYNIYKMLQSKYGGDNIKSQPKPMIQGLFS